MRRIALLTVLLVTLQAAGEPAPLELRVSSFGEPRPAAGGVTPKIDDRSSKLDSEREAAARWMKQHAVALTSVEAGHGFDDLAPVGKMVGNARLVALGEATHGTREFFQLKHRMLEYLVATKGFTVFGIEASFPDALAVNDYVLHGTGDPAAALAGLGFWTWNTDEVLDLIKWMRAWNADPAHTELETNGEVAADAEAIAFGLLFTGDGTAWMDDAVLEVVP